jgi:hypothetical protein
MLCPQVAAGGDGLQVLRAVVNILNKQSWTTSRRWPFSTRFNVRPETPFYKEPACCEMLHRALGRAWPGSGRAVTQTDIPGRLDFPFRLPANHHHRPGTSVWVTALPLIKIGANPQSYIIYFHSKLSPWVPAISIWRKKLKLETENTYGAFDNFLHDYMNDDIACRITRKSLLHCPVNNTRRQKIHLITKIGLYLLSYVLFIFVLHSVYTSIWTLRILSCFILYISQLYIDSCNTYVYT